MCSNRTLALKSIKADSPPITAFLFGNGKFISLIGITWLETFHRDYAVLELCLLIFVNFVNFVISILQILLSVCLAFQII